MDDPILKEKWPFPQNMKSPPWTYKLRTAIIVSMVGGASKLWLSLFSRVNVHNIQALLHWVGDRPKGRGLVTVTNHFSCVDDPVVWGLLKWKHLLNSSVMRWSTAAHDICFVSPAHNFFFSSGKTVPIVRGAGVYQRSMNFCVDRLEEGAWVHIFPEGKVNMTQEDMRFKWGVGRLVYDTPGLCPIVLPFYLMGMDSVLPNIRPYIPKIGKLVTVVIGDPIDFSQEIAELRERKASAEEARKLITDRIQEALLELRSKAEKLHTQALVS